MREFIDYIAKEWKVIGQAPFTFITGAVLMFGLIFGGFEWHFAGVIAENDATIHEMEDRPTAQQWKDKQDQFDGLQRDLDKERKRAQADLAHEHADADRQLNQARADTINLKTQIQMLTTQVGTLQSQVNTLKTAAHDKQVQANKTVDEIVASLPDNMKKSPELLAAEAQCKKSIAAGRVGDIACSRPLGRFDSPNSDLVNKLNSLHGP